MSKTINLNVSVNLYFLLCFLTNDLSQALITHSQGPELQAYSSLDISFFKIKKKFEKSEDIINKYVSSIKPLLKDTATHLSDLYLERKELGSIYSSIAGAYNDIIKLNRSLVMFKRSKQQIQLFKTNEDNDNMLVLNMLPLQTKERLEQVHTSIV